MIMNVEKQIQYWIDAANENVDVAEFLINGKKTVECLFFCHLALETILKAHLTKFTKQTPPKIHNLISIADKANLELDDQTRFFFSIMNKFQMEGRYRNEIAERPIFEIAKNYFEVTKQKIKWLKEKL